MNFDEYIGQKKVKETLSRILESKKISHAYSFEGQKGLGKTTLAKIFAKSILCNENNMACNCSSCKKFDSGNHPDFFIVNLEKLSIGIEEIRNMQKKLGIKPIESEKKVVIVDDAAEMTEEAQNSLLKTLEEPDCDTIIILSVSNNEKMLKTIKSRTIKINFDSYSFDEIRTILINEKCDEGMLEFATKCSEGVPGRAKKFIDKEYIEFRDNIIDLISKIKTLEIENLYKIDFIKIENKNQMEEMLDILLVWFRDLGILNEINTKNLNNKELIINIDKMNVLEHTLKGLDKNKVIKVIEIIEEARKFINRFTNQQMVLDNLLLNIWEVYNG